ncbi:MAG: DUF3046 domain-containing protein [Varibaculum sp.]|nr:DUF3046 domain-containing protein [Varibaculum sp.]
MKRSEFFDSLNRVYGSAYGDSIIHDLVLTEFGSSAWDALEAGADPQTVWAALITETDRDPALIWVHRANRNSRRKPAHSPGLGF